NTIIINELSDVANNTAPIGGGGYFNSVIDLRVTDASFFENKANLGGGLYVIDSTVDIKRTMFVGNDAQTITLQQDDIDDEVAEPGYGGGLYMWSSDGTVADCRIKGNYTSGSGGGIYVAGNPAYFWPESVSSPEFNNCLITDNTAYIDGGGISANWYAEPTITNCTVANNETVRAESLGGGLFASYASNVTVKDSIIWENIAANGAQVAVSSGNMYEPYPSTIDITYSDVRTELEDGEYGAPIDADGLPVIRPGFNQNTLAANDDESTDLVDIGFPIDFFGTTYTGLYVNNNGNVTFDLPLWEFTPFGLTERLGMPIIAPFFGDVDTRGEGSELVKYSYGAGVIDGYNAFGVNWVNVGYFASHTDKLNSFQLIIIDRSDRGSGFFDVEFN
ncbi:hypothetical protein LCGC14_2880980, partial [marine sediment metagenome]